MKIAIDNLKNIIKHNDKYEETLKDIIKHTRAITKKAKEDLECIKKGAKTTEDVLKKIFEDAPVSLERSFKKTKCFEEEDSDEESWEDEKVYKRGYKNCKFCNESIPARTIVCNHCCNLPE